MRPRPSRRGPPLFPPAHTRSRLESFLPSRPSQPFSASSACHLTQIRLRFHRWHSDRAPFRRHLRCPHPATSRPKCRRRPCNGRPWANRDVWGSELRSSACQTEACSVPRRNSLSLPSPRRKRWTPRWRESRLTPRAWRRCQIGACSARRLISPSLLFHRARGNRETPRQPGPRNRSTTRQQGKCRIVPCTSCSARPQSSPS
jgi:hypothetical protein